LAAEEGERGEKEQGARECSKTGKMTVVYLSTPRRSVHPVAKSKGSGE